MPQGSGFTCSWGTCVARSGGSQPGVTPRARSALGYLRSTVSSGCPGTGIGSFLSSFFIAHDCPRSQRWRGRFRKCSGKAPGTQQWRRVDLAQCRAGRSPGSSHCGSCGMRDFRIEVVPPRPSLLLCLTSRMFSIYWVFNIFHKIPESAETCRVWWGVLSGLPIKHSLLKLSSSLGTVNCDVGLQLQLLPICSLKDANNLTF